MRGIPLLRLARLSTPHRRSSVWSCNEWDPLEEAIVGRPELGVVPRLTPEVRACVMPAKRSFFERNAGRYWADALPPGHWKRLQEEIEELCRVLQGEGVTVRRPDCVDWATEFALPDAAGGSTGVYGAMPRDSLLVVGDEIIEAGMAWRSRFFEYRAYRRLVVEFWRDGARWTTAPKPSGRHLTIKEEPDSSQRFATSEEEPDSSQRFATSEEEPDSSQRFATSEEEPDSSQRFATSEEEPCFDAADFLRAGRDVFGQRSQVTNLAGIEWLRRHLRPRGIRVHRLRFRDARPMHIDATFSLVRPGLALQNPQRPLLNSKIFEDAGWRLVDCPPPATDVADLPRWLGSKWLSMNTLMLDTKRVLIERQELPLRRLFESLGVTPVPVSMRHCHTVGGGLHCWTADIRRRGRMEKYF